MLKLVDFFEYKNGNLFWKKNGKAAGSLTKDGYIRIMCNNHRVMAHKIIFFMHHRCEPKHIDHVNGIKNDNRIENLRAATKIQNGQNIGKPSSNTSGFKNVSFSYKKWIVRIKINKKNICFGSYDDIELAALVAEEARNKYHKEFANHASR